MSFWKSVQGMVTVELTSSDPAGAITAINGAGIPIYLLESKETLTIRFVTNWKLYWNLQKLCDKRGEILRISGKSGIYWSLYSLRNRPIFLVGIVVVLMLAMYLPTRIFFVRVEGNQKIPTRAILEQAELCGIRFGTSRREVRSEKMKNALLAAIPELQWAGINTAGCTAVISVRERSDTETENQDYTVSRIVAIRDGVITSCTATRGNMLCRVGQAVTAGETLISGYTDCGLSIRAERAEGEIYGETERLFSAVTPVWYDVLVDNTLLHKKYSLIIGKKRINFYKDSGISGTSCAKMYEEYCITLPGGFALPVKLSVENWIRLETESVPVSEDYAQQLLTDFSQRYLTGQMIAGQILKKEETVLPEDGLVRLTGEYICHELIGQEQSEEIIDSYEQTD